MAQLSNSFATFDAIGLREQLADEIYNINPEETPFVSSIGKEKAYGVYEEWQTETLAAAANNKVEQGNEASAAAVTPTVRVGNRTQISEKVYAVTRTQEIVQKAGRKSEVAHQDAKKMVELKRDMEFAALQNTTAIAAASGTAPQARGVLGWLATNTSKGTGGADPSPTSNTAPTDGTLRSFTEAMLKDVAQQCWEEGGNPTKLFVPAALRATVSGFTGGATKFDKTEDKTLNATVEVYVGDFGRYSIINSRHQRARDCFLIDPDMWSLMTLSPMKGEDLAKTGDSKKRLINTEWTLKCKNEAASGAIRDLQA
jgi:hypothetical protein